MCGVVSSSGSCLPFYGGLNVHVSLVPRMLNMRCILKPFVNPLFFGMTQYGVKNKASNVGVGVALYEEVVDSYHP